MRELVRIHYQLHSNRANYLKTLRTDWIFLDLKPEEVYDMTTNVLELILQIVSSQKLADLPHL